MTAFEQIVQHIENKKSFILEAGAGSGKTYTLIQTLNYLIESKGDEIKYNHQKIICITYTNIAKNEIIERLENNPLVLVSTIHEFLWSCIKSYQKQLKIELCKLNEIRYNEDLAKGKTDTRYSVNLVERISNVYNVNYDDSSFRDFEKGILDHDDLIVLAKMMFENNELLTTILYQKYPFILVDEYQDTAKETITSLIDYLLERNKSKIVLGFYGDSHQKIYESGVGDLENYYINENTRKIEIVKKEENYRSSKEVIKLLNNFRTNIKQIPQNRFEGSVKFIYCTYSPPRSTRINKKNETVFDETITNYEARIEKPKNDNYDNVIAKLSNERWDFGESSQDKILVIANSRVAKRSGFGELYQIYSRRNSLTVKEQLLDRNHSLIRHFTGYIDKKSSKEREIGLEHLVYFWQTKNYNEVIRFIKKNGSLLNGEFKHSKKKIIAELLNTLIEIRKDKTIREVFNFIEEKNILRKSESLSKFKERVSVNLDSIIDVEIRDKVKRDKDLFDAFMDLPYMQIMNLFKHTQNHTVFSTKHGTKGDEFRNVLTVIDDTEWKSEYNFENFFNDSEEKPERKLRTRNLFYVECSRAKENLVILALSEMNEEALNKVISWFGKENVLAIEKFIK